jgi:hypothetical protein
MGPLVPVGGSRAEGANRASQHAADRDRGVSERLVSRIEGDAFQSEDHVTGSSRWL